MSDDYKAFTQGCFRAIFYYFMVVAICALSHSVDKVGMRTVDKLHAIEAAEGSSPSEDVACKVRVDDSYDEVYRLSTVVLRRMYLSRCAAVQEALAEYKEEMAKKPKTPEEEVPETDSMSDLETPQEEKKTPLKGMKIPWLSRVFTRYSENHEVPTSHIFWLRLKKNWLLFVYEVISFCNHNLLDIIRLVNIGMMTVACGGCEMV